ncbi:MAG: hypothetical protein L6243_04255 [Candidatus Altiarchaeales archaeon]|nr:hypothetical protein [Candidatus Altiarchaeota archaeon]MBU4266623.1 hypothetical protein [Candidatus Altiarchaeota archaeon]MCG2782782.1 hypothetical protein [Candidatus Altiarchaeales archaeon]
MLEDALLIILSYGLLGAGIKYIDQAYDIGVFDKGIANMIAIPSGILMAYLIIFDSTSAIIFLAIILALSITQKIDAPAFYIGTALVISIPVLFRDILQIEWAPFGILIFSGILDEIGNDWADKRLNKRLVNHKSMKNNNGFLNKLGEKFFLNRFAMKLSILVLVVFSVFSWIYLAAFLFFDFMYIVVERYSFHIKIYSISR